MNVVLLEETAKIIANLLNTPATIENVENCIIEGIGYDEYKNIPGRFAKDKASYIIDRVVFNMKPVYNIDEILNILEDSETIDDAISYFSNINPDEIKLEN